MTATSGFSRNCRCDQRSTICHNLLRPGASRNAKETLGAKRSGCITAQKLWVWTNVMSWEPEWQLSTGCSVKLTIDLLPASMRYHAALQICDETAGSSRQRLEAFCQSKRGDGITTSTVDNYASRTLMNACPLVVVNSTWPVSSIHKDTANSLKAAVLLAEIIETCCGRSPPIAFWGRIVMV